MNNINHLVKLFGAVLVVCAAATSCYNYDEVPLVTLAAFENEIIIEPDGGTFNLNFYTNSSYHIEYVTEADWLTVTTSKAVDGIATLTGTCEPNRKYKRRADFVLCSDLDTRRDTVVVKQKGISEICLEYDNASIVLPGTGGMTTSTIHTNVAFEDMAVGIVYTDASNTGWVTDVNIIDSNSTDRELCITTEQNTDEVAPRTATVYLSFTDGWGDFNSINIVLLQCNANEEAGRQITFEEFRNEYAKGEAIFDYVLLSGIVVSNRDNGNAGEPNQQTTSTIDFTPTAMTFYLESEDGRYGINVQTASEEDNVFNQFDHVTLLLYGATGKMLESDPAAPACYQLTRVEKTMIYSRTAGSANDVPVKERAIGELTDDDIYTYVKLKNVEFPIRKGGLWPIDGSYCNTCGSERITKYPLLVRDINGADIYLLTNDKCAYHRDGTRLPYGSGSISGVVVHEHFSRYEWRSGADPADIDNDETLANIGRYSLRHQTKEDVWGDMDDDFETGFSALLCEYRYKVISSSNIVPSYGSNGWLTHTYQEKYTGSSEKNYAGTSNTHITNAVSYDYLGPVGRTTTSTYGINYGNLNGIGVIIDEDKENTSYETNRFAINDDGKLELACQYSENQYCGYGSAGWNESYKETYYDAYKNVPNGGNSSSNVGRGMIQAGAHVTFANHYWWDDDTDEPYGFLLYFSTGTVSNPLSMQISIRAVTSAGYTPRYWCVEWNTTDGRDDDSDWSQIAEFTLPDAPNWEYPTIWQMPGGKGMNFSLPTEMLGQDSVYIRIRPTSDVCSSKADYADARLKDSASGKALAEEHGVSISYLAIRYNK